MKITDIEAIHTRVEDPNIGLFDGSYDDCIICVYTDEGITGIGEVESLADAVQAIVYAKPAHSKAWGLRELLVGRDPSNPRELWNLMYESTSYVGRCGLMMHAIGGVDIALWDIAGQIAGKPVCELLGGKRRGFIEAYGTIYPMAQSEDGVRGQVEDALTRLHLRNIKFAAERGMIIDAALSYKTADEGLRLIPIFKDVQVLFLEAPLPLDDLEGHARMAEAGIPLGVGDLGLTHVREFVDAMEKGGASICQLDITSVGGFTGIEKIADAARQREKRVITHGYKTNIEIAANLQFLANHWAAEMLELSTSRSPLRWETTRESIEVGEDGMVPVPLRPGLGVTLNERTIERYRVAPPYFSAAVPV